MSPQSPSLLYKGRTEQTPALLSTNTLSSPPHPNYLQTYSSGHHVFL